MNNGVESKETAELTPAQQRKWRFTKNLLVYGTIGAIALMALNDVQAMRRMMEESRAVVTVQQAEVLAGPSAGVTYSQQGAVASMKVCKTTGAVSRCIEYLKNDSN